MAVVRGRGRWREGATGDAGGGGAGGGTGGEKKGGGRRGQSGGLDLKHDDVAVIEFTSDQRFINIHVTKIVHQYRRA